MNNQKPNYEQIYPSNYLRSHIIKQNIGLKAYSLKKKNKSKNKLKITIDLSPIQKLKRKSLESSTIQQLVNLLPNEKFDKVSDIFSASQDLNSTLKTQYDSNLKSCSRKISQNSFEKQNNILPNFKKIQKFSKIKKFLPQNIDYQSNLSSEQSQKQTDNSFICQSKFSISQNEQQQDNGTKNKIQVQNFQDKKIDIEFDMQIDNIETNFVQSFHQDISGGLEILQIQNSYQSKKTKRKSSLCFTTENKITDQKSDQAKRAQNKLENSKQNQIFKLQNGQQNKAKKKVEKNSDININIMDQKENYLEQSKKNKQKIQIKKKYNFRQRRSPKRQAIYRHEKILQDQNYKRKSSKNLDKQIQRKKRNKKLEKILGFNAERLLSSKEQVLYTLSINPKQSSKIRLDDPNKVYNIYSTQKNRFGIYLKFKDEEKRIENKQITLNNNIDIILENRFKAY